MIRIENLALALDGAPILQGIDTEIPASGLTAVIGPNGAGKSSLLHCLAGLVQPRAAAFSSTASTFRRRNRPSAPAASRC